MIGINVIEAYDRAMDAATRLNKAEEVSEQIRLLVAANGDDAASRFVRQALQGRMRDN